MRQKAVSYAVCLMVVSGCLPAVLAAAPGGGSTGGGGPSGAFTSARLIIDGEPPQVTIASPANGSTVDEATFDVSGFASDNAGVSRVEVSLSGIEWSLASGTKSWTFENLTVPEGVSAIYAKATDYADNSNITWITVAYVPGGANDTRLPGIAITSPANGTILDHATFNLSGTASDDTAVAKVEVSLSAITWWMASGTGSWTYAGLTIGEGINTVYAMATDYAGNTNITWITLAYVPGGASDTGKPRVSITSPANNSILDHPTFNLSGTASDDYGVAKVEVSLSGIEWTMASGTDSWTYAGLTIGEGGNSVFARATDHAGNFNTTSITVTYAPPVPDTRPPVINITSPANWSLLNTSSIRLSGTASDDTGVTKVEVSQSGIDWELATGTESWTFGDLLIPEGVSSVYARATDRAGNTAVAWITLAYEPGVLNDTRKPQVRITSPANGSALGNATFYLSGTASDDRAVLKVEVSLNGIAWVPADGTDNWTCRLTVGEGVSAVYARATDIAGNVNSTWITLAYAPGGLMDNQKPQITITSPANGTVLAAALFNLAGTASDNYGVARVEVSLSGIAWLAASGTTAWSYTGLVVGEGGSTVWVRATDFAGNSNITSLSVLYIPGGDTVKPALNFTSLKDKAKVSGGKLSTLSGTVSDNVDVRSVELRVNGAVVPVTFGNGTWTARNITLKEGTNAIVVTATDGSNNTGVRTIIVTYEKAKPQPGFGVLLLVAAILAGLALAPRRRD